MIQQTLTAGQHIPPGGIEIPGIPRIGYIAGTAGIVHQQMYFRRRIPSADPVHTADVGLIHTDQKVVCFIVTAPKLTGGLAATADPVFCQLASDRRINGIANLLRTGCGRTDLKLAPKPGLMDQIPHHKLGHGASADIAMADEKYSHHDSVFLYMP